MREPRDAAAIDGWFPDLRRVPSPNFDARPAGTVAELLVIHAISLPPRRYGGSCIEDLFLNRLDIAADPYFAGLAGLRVSAHFLVRRDGASSQFVSIADRAWHAGVSCFRGRSACNDFSIGIELEGCDEDPFTDAQYAALLTLTRRLLLACPAIMPETIVGHADIAPGRRTDPGPCCDCPRYRAGLEAGDAGQRGSA
jgi:AmpD protein